MIQSSCPSCGAPLTFEATTSLLAVCDYCHSTVIRKDLDLELLGKVSEVQENYTPIQIGAIGKFQGTGFKVIGRVQVRWEGGLWNEWFVMMADGREGWLAEANGQLTMLFPDEKSDVFLKWNDCDVGDPITLNAGDFSVVERRKARVVGAEGELPFHVGDGWELPYVDLRSPGNKFATLDYAESGPPKVYVGPMVRLKDLAMTGLRAFRGWDNSGVDVGGELVDVQSEAFNCPTCAAPLAITVPGQTQRIGCDNCGALLEAEDDNLKVLERWAQGMGETLLKVGQRGRLAGIQFEIVGYVRKQVREGGVLYPWIEYLLFNPYEGYRWLVESQGHWSFVEPCMGIPKPNGSDGMVLRGTQFRFFQLDSVEVAHVVGQFYWRVEIGQQVRAADYIAPPYMLSSESDGEEEVWSIGTYLEAEAVQTAFSCDYLPSLKGIAPNQPFDSTGRVQSIYRSFLVMAAVLALVVVGQIATSSSKRVASISGVAEGQLDEAIQWSEPFTLTGGAKAMEVKTSSGVNNAWLYLDMALVNEASGEIVLFGSEMEYWSGPGWSEGSHNRNVVFGPVGAGEWVLKVAPVWDQRKAPNPPPPFSVTLIHDVPRYFPGILGLLFLGMLPVAAKLYELSFENRRWNP